MNYMKSLLIYRKEKGDVTEQQRLMQLLSDVTEGRTNDDELKNFLVQHKWSKSEVARRLIHALSKMKNERAELYPYASAS